MKINNKLNSSSMVIRRDSSIVAIVLACITTFCTLSIVFAESLPPIPDYKELTPKMFVKSSCRDGEVERLGWYVVVPDEEKLEDLHAYDIGTWRWEDKDVMIVKYSPNDDGKMRLWIDLDGDGHAEEYYDSYEAMQNKYPHTCHIIKAAAEKAASLPTDGD